MLFYRLNPLCTPLCKMVYKLNFFETRYKKFTSVNICVQYTVSTLLVHFLVKKCCSPDSIS